MEKRTMLLVFNPKSGLMLFAANLFEVLNKLTKSGFIVTVYPTQERNDAYDIVLNMGSGFDSVVCSGGDGTVNEVINALMRLGKKPGFGYIPSGTTNDFAASLGIPGDILQAAGALCGGEIRPIDIGCFNGRYFTYVAAFGLFTDVSYVTPQGLKNMIGHAAYMIEGVKRLKNIRSYHCVAECDGEIIEGDFVFGMVTNSTSVGGIKIPFDDMGSDSDGKFELILMKRLEHFSQIQDAVSMLLGSGIPGDSFIVRSAHSIKLRSEAVLDWTIDGEYAGGYTEADILIFNKVLNMMLPAPDSND